MKFSNWLFNRIVQANFEKGFKLVKSNYTGRNYWRIGRTSLNAIEEGCDSEGVDTTEYYPTKKMVLQIIKFELKLQISSIAHGDWIPGDDNITRILAQLIVL